MPETDPYIIGQRVAQFSINANITSVNAELLRVAAMEDPDLGPLISGENEEQFLAGFNDMKQSSALQCLIMSKEFLGYTGE